MPSRTRPKRYTVSEQNYVNLYHLILAFGQPTEVTQEDDGIKIFHFYDAKKDRMVNYFWTVKDSDDPHNIAPECVTLAVALDKYKEIIKPETIAKDITIIPLVEINKRKHFNTIAICDNHACLIEPRSSNRQILFNYDINPVKTALENTNLKFYNLFIGQQSYFNDEDCGAYQINHTLQLAQLTSLENPVEVKEHLKLSHLDERSEDAAKFKIVHKVLWNEKENQLNIAANNLKALNFNILENHLNDNHLFKQLSTDLTFEYANYDFHSNKTFADLSNLPSFYLFLAWLEAERTKDDAKLGDKTNGRTYWDTMGSATRPAALDIYNAQKHEDKQKQIINGMLLNNILKNKILDRCKISAAMELLEQEYTHKYQSLFFKTFHTRHQSVTWLKENLGYAKDAHAAAVFIYRYYQAIPEYGSALSQTLEKIMVKLLDIETCKFEQASKQRDFATTFDKGTDPVIALIQQKLTPKTITPKNSSQQKISPSQFALKELYKYINLRETSFKYKVLIGKAKSIMDEKLKFARELIICLSSSDIESYQSSGNIVYLDNSDILQQKIDRIKPKDDAVLQGSKLNEILNKLKTSIDNNLTHSKR